MTFSPRVLQVIASVSPQRGGPSEAIFPMARALLDHGISTEIVTTNDDGEGLLRAPLNEVMLRGGVPVRFFARYSPPIRSVREYAYAGEFRRWLQRHLHNYDLLHVHGLFSYLPSLAMHLARAAGVPYVNRPLGMLGRWPLEQSARRKRLYLAAGEEMRLRGAAAMHFTSKAEQLEAEASFSLPQGLVIPHGSTLPALIPNAKAGLREHLKLPRTQRILLFLGRLHPKKGLDLLLTAFAGLCDPNVTLVLAGEGEPAFVRQLESLLEEHELTHRVRWTGLVTGEAKQLLLQGADLFVLPSFHENFGVAVLEALAAGTPVLISDQVALADEVGKYRLGKVVTLNPDDIREGMRSLLDKPCALNSSELGEWVASRYSWRKNAEALIALYQCVLETS